MPNWCSNQLVMFKRTGADYASIVKNAETEGLFGQFFKCPEELTATDLHTWAGGERGEALEKARQDMIAKYGYPNEYEWNIANYGTKWDVMDVYYSDLDEDTMELTLEFDTAWTPPTGFYEHLVSLGWEISGYYWEPGMMMGGTFKTIRPSNGKLYLVWNEENPVVKGSPVYDELMTLGVLTDEDFVDEE